MAEQIEEIEGFIAYFDLLGFSNSIRYGETFTGKISKFREILFEAIEVDASNLEYVSFSDSVIINSRSKGEKVLLELLWALSEIIYRMALDLGVVLCGCVSVGKFTKISDEDGNIMITGDPILDAIKYEKKQNWIGIMLSPRILKEYPEIRKKWFETRPSLDYLKIMKKDLTWLVVTRRYAKIPFNDNEFYNGFVVVPKHPLSFTLNNVFRDLINFRDKLDELSVYADDVYAQKKYNNTICFIDSLIQDSRDLSVSGNREDIFTMDIYDQYKHEIQNDKK